MCNIEVVKTASGMQEENTYAIKNHQTMEVRMKSQLLKISWGYVEVGNTRLFCTLWLETGSMNLKLKVRVPNEMSYSYVCTSKDGPSVEGKFLGYWIPKNVYFPAHFCGDLNNLVRLVFEHLNLKFFKESRKWLTPHEKNVAELVAFSGICDDDIRHLLGCRVSNLPQAFWDYVKWLNKEYCNYLRGKKMLHDQLNTPAGLERMLWWLRNNPIPSGLAVSSIEHYLLQQGL